MNGLTEQQQEVFKFIKLYKKSHGYPPSRNEISQGFGWSSANAAQQHLRAIERKGYIRLLPGKIARGIVVLKK